MGDVVHLATEIGDFDRCGIVYGDGLDTGKGDVLGYTVSSAISVIPAMLMRRR